MIVITIQTSFNNDKLQNRPLIPDATRALSKIHAYSAFHVLFATRYNILFIIDSIRALNLS